MHLVALIDDETTAHKILSHLGLPNRPPPRGPPWRPQRPLFPDKDPLPAHDLVDPPSAD